MQFTVRSEALLDAYTKILSIIDRKISRPILVNNLVTASDDSISVYATDLEVSAKITIRGTVLSPGKFCINTKNFFDILKELPNEDLEITQESGTNNLKLKCDKSDFTLAVVPYEDYPVLNFSSSKGSFELSSDALLSLVNKVSFAISHDETRPFLNGIFFQVIDKSIRAVAVDGYRMGLFDIESSSIDSKQLVDGIIVPKKGIYELKKLAESNPGIALTFSLDESFFYVNAGDHYSLSTRLIAREFPKYQSHIPSKTTCSLSVDKSSFLSAIRRVKVLANEKTNGIKLFLTGSKLIISASHAVFGDASETVSISYSGPDISIGFNAKYLMDVLAVLPDSDVIIEFNNEVNPILVKCPDLPRFLGIVMPLKL